MPGDARLSLTTGDLPVTFYWHDHRGANCASHIGCAVEALWQSIQQPGVRVWSPQLTAITRAEFRDLLVAASRGLLRPREDVKVVREHDPRPVYEIRWTHVSVAEAKSAKYPAGRFYDAHVRLYHAEPTNGMGLALVGLYCHEKNLQSDDQDDHIDEALRLYDVGLATFWGWKHKSLLSPLDEDYRV